MSHGTFRLPAAKNETIRAYLPGSTERASLKAELSRQTELEAQRIPLVIGGKRVETEERSRAVMPHEHRHVLADYARAGAAELKAAIDAAMAAKERWSAMPFEHRAAIFLRAAELLAGPWRDKINAATMLGQSKTAFQSEIDAACELCDFLRFDLEAAERIYREQPSSAPGIWNRNDFRPLDGFVLAISPFNFTSIGGNLPIAPAIMGNVVVWKPASTAVLSNYYFMQLLEEAGLPAGVINFVPSSGRDVSEYVLKDPRLGGFHFTGSTATFNAIWKTIGENIASYQQYPRLIAETGGKDFIFAHPSARVDILVAAMLRGAYEFQGQKCSAASRAYIPASLWPEVKKRFLKGMGELSVGDPRDFRNFLCAVIDEAAFRSITAYIDEAKANPDVTVYGGEYDMSKGYFIHPTLIESRTPDSRSMREEIFGPVLSVYVYEDDQLEATLALCDQGSPYALTGAIFSQDRAAIVEMEAKLAHSAGNFYINDKPTGAVVGQQPFGGSRASGTNDKAGSIFNMIRWTSPRCIKENLIPSTAVDYPFMADR